MYTYQDLQKNVSENDRMAFVLSAINEHKASKEYKIARDAEEYYKHRNPTIEAYQKFIFDQFGRTVPDVWSANHKIASNWYYYFVTQETQYLLGNGVSFGDDMTKEKLGKGFDHAVQELATAAQNGGVSFGFWDADHIEVFPITQFVPLYDEENGSLSAGIRFWQIDNDKPLRATLYELDGYTKYIKRKESEMQVYAEKRSYLQTVHVSEIGGEEIIDRKNYPSFPIVPMFNVNRQSALVGNRGTIDAYDLIASGFVNNVDDGEFIYWILKNCGAMDSVDDAKFVEQLKLTHVAHADGDAGATVESHKVEVPYASNEAALERLEKIMFHDFMALNVESISSGNVTATQIEAAYDPINEKTDMFEYNVTQFIEGIFAIAGIDDVPTYTRSIMTNVEEKIQTILQAAEYLDDEYITKKILTLLGDADEFDGVMERKISSEVNRFMPSVKE